LIFFLKSFNKSGLDPYLSPQRFNKFVRPTSGGQDTAMDRSIRLFSVNSDVHNSSYSEQRRYEDDVQNQSGYPQ
jgi:hypothetical protein